jgi:hypothetical protein
VFLGDANQPAEPMVEGGAAHLLRGLLDKLGKAQIRMFGA